MVKNGILAMIDPTEFRVDVYRGGATVVRVTHMPTGMVETVDADHGEIKARRECFAALEKRLKEQNEISPEW